MSDMRYQTSIGDTLIAQDGPHRLHVTGDTAPTLLVTEPSDAGYGLSMCAPTIPGQHDIRFTPRTIGTDHPEEPGSVGEIVSRLAGRCVCGV